METEIHDVLDRLRESETIGESVLRDRSEIVQLDRIRQKNREALTALKKSDPNDSIYLCIGNMFIKHHNQRAQSLIQQEQKQIDEHLEKLYKQVKDNVASMLF
ncbi:Blot13 allergen [Sarcoptes scabiei]|nr:Blot13 allergen [Sarcoptes scabiei]